MKLLFVLCSFLSQGIDYFILFYNYFSQLPSLNSLFRIWMDLTLQLFHDTISGFIYLLN